ncbi:putative carboxylesterase [Helianthus annuus]|nr:putative carboxylesterase [Helianthus annuus]
MSKNMFGCEVELGKFLGSIDIIPYAFCAILETSSTYEIRKSPSGIQVLAFNCSSDYTTQFLDNEFGLVSSEEHKVLDFISAGEVNPSFSINKAAVELFENLTNDLEHLKYKLEAERCPLVVTGRGLGGYVAILFALWLHQAVDVKESDDDWSSKRPVCITFGCPLVGDENLGRIISKYPQWDSRFLNVVAKDDRVASVFSSNSRYRPFGTFLFCTESGARTAFQDQDLILAVLDKMGLPRTENMKTPDYAKLFGAIRRKTLYRGVSESGEFNKPEYFRDLIDIGGVEEKRKMMRKGNRKIYDQTKKVNDMKIKMVNIEMYMNMTRSNGGIYDFYKKPNKSKEEIHIENKITSHQRALTKHWQDFVEETKQRPQREDAKMRKRWLYNGHNYRRMIEPLSIAEYYKTVGNRDYIGQRPPHYLELEKLLKPYIDPSNGNKKAASLTQDSCFWAYVEESLILLTDLKREDLSHNLMNNIKGKLDLFEEYVMRSINDYSVSPDIFLTGSSFMKWWHEYKACKGSSYVSELARYMNNGSYSLYK